MLLQTDELFVFDSSSITSGHRFASISMVDVYHCRENVSCWMSERFSKHAAAVNGARGIAFTPRIVRRDAAYRYAEDKQMIWGGEEGPNKMHAGCV